MAAGEKDLWNRIWPRQKNPTFPGFVLGYHGTDISLVNDAVLLRQELKPSLNSWDWLGHGIYFWEYSASRALQYAESLAGRKHSSIRNAGVIGAILDLGNCLDLLDYQNLATVKRTYDRMETPLKLLENKPASSPGGKELLRRYLDCAVFENLHKEMAEQNLPTFDSVRAVFWEGNLLYPTAGFREKNHIQICIRNPSCIKGLFIPTLK